MQTESVHLWVEQNSMLFHVNATAMTSRRAHHSSQVVDVLPANLEAEPFLFLCRSKPSYHMYIQKQCQAHTTAIQMPTRNTCMSRQHVRLLCRHVSVPPVAQLLEQQVSNLH